MAAGRDRRLVLDKVEQFDSAAGIRVRGTAADKALALGKLALMQPLAVAASALADQAEAPRRQGAGVTHL